MHHLINFRSVYAKCSKCEVIVEGLEEICENFDFIRTSNNAVFLNFWCKTCVEREEYVDA